MANPLAQFEIYTIAPIKIGGINASFTNAAAFMAAIVVAITVLLLVGMRRRALIPGRMQSAAELSYEFVARMVRDNVGTAGRGYFPFVFSLFMFILFANMIGLIPFSFTVTGQLIVTFSFAIFVFVGVTLVGFICHGLRFFTFFMPAGTPWQVAPLLIPVEILSYFTRPISLSVRLFANMMVGHTMLQVFAGFIITLGILGGWAPLLFITALTGLEFIIAFLQAFVFAVLTCIYLNDSIHMHSH